jgi:altronate hydrolase
MQQPILKLHDSDNVAVALRDLRSGEVLPADNIVIRDSVPRGHKVAVAGIARGEPVCKYNHVIGSATVAIQAGDHVHLHNLGMREHVVADEGIRERSVVDDKAPLDYLTFMGYRRSDGKVATRNYIGILPSVNCAASVSRFIADEVRARGVLSRYPHIDGIVAVSHGLGCGVSARGEGLEILQRTLAGYARQPNFGGVLVVGLGCEVNQTDRLFESQGLAAGARLRAFDIQDVGGTQAAVEAGVQQIAELAPLIDSARRERAPVSELVLALQCGGSDGFSGITANPALGVASDLIVRHGGTVILSETPEIYGAESLLIARADTPVVAEKLIARIHWWENYARVTGTDLDNNPSPGNHEGGLTTILEKSLGAIAKAGSTRLMDVVQYAEPIATKGFVFMDSPGYDPCAVTGQVASGATIICFTTGRGSVSGFKPVPCVKLATNTEMFRRMEGDMDLDCGVIVGTRASVAEVGREIFELLIAIASGHKVKSEHFGFGDHEIVPWHVGATV